VSCALAGSASAQVPRSFWGVIPINDLNAAEIDKMGTANVGTIRTLVLWPKVEPEPDNYDWSYLDFLVANAAANGIEMLPFLYGTPTWAGQDCGGLDDRSCEAVPPLSGAPKAAWTDFLVALVNRYGPQGTLWSDGSDPYDPPYVPITRWQIWNEPSSRTYYRPKPKAKGYAKLVRISHDAIASVDPSAEVVLAGVFPQPEGGKKVEFTRYLGQLFDVKRIGKYFDSAALHPYARTIGKLKKQIRAYRKELRQGGLGGKPLWISEIGWGSDPPVDNRPLIKGPEGQRDLLQSSFELLAKSIGRWRLAGVLWYAFRDPGVGYENCPFCSSAGLLEEGGEPKPAWYSFLGFTGGSDSEPVPPPPPPPPPPDGCPVPPLPC
jgi:polysaccharide biosynthesis protein PslG